MKIHLISILACGLAAAASSASAQTTIVSPTNFVTSGTTATVSVGGAQISMVLSIAYNLNLSPASLYVAHSQLAADLQSLFTSYPSPQDPIEAIASSVMTGIIQKYPQINGGTLAVTVLVPPLSITTASVYMGTLGPVQSNTSSAKATAGDIKSK